MVSAQVVWAAEIRKFIGKFFAYNKWISEFIKFQFLYLMPNIRFMKSTNRFLHMPKFFYPVLGYPKHAFWTKYKG